MAKLSKTLRETHPEIADMWIYELNGDLTPDNVSIYSDKEAFFRCDHNPKHIYKKHICNMVSRRDGHITGCIYCGPNAKEAFPGETDLLSVIKEAKDMWDYDKNDIDPTKLLPKSNKYAYFKCEMGHSTYRKIQDFSRSPSCPECQKQKSLLENTVPQTKEFWDYKKNIDIELGSVVQSANEMVWFKCPECDYEWKCTIQLWRKNAYCACCGFDGKDHRSIDEKVITVKMRAPEIVDAWDYEKNSEQTPDSLTWKSNYVAHFKCKSGHVFQRSISEMFRDGKFRGCIVCKPRRKSICLGKNALFSRCLEAKEMWDFELNQSLSPDTLTMSSTEVAHFVCSEGHKFECKINLFTKNPICRQCDLINNRSIANKRPDMLKFWDYSKNDIDPYYIRPYDKRDAFWKCNNCGYEWEQKIYNRASSTKGLCPSCNLKRRYSKSQNNVSSFQHYNPEAAKLWVNDLNNGILPELVAPKSGKAITMRCIRNDKHIYRIKICDIPNEEPFGCPFCRDRSIIFQGETDLFSVSEIAKKMWSYDENTGFDLQSRNPKSAEKVVWICSYGHHFNRSISSFMISQTCPICKKEKYAIARFPHMTEQWDFDKNPNIDIHVKSSNSKDSAHWKCKKCGYEWIAQISSRKASKGLCPCCETRIVVVKGINDLFSVVPDLREWYDDKKNTNIDISTLSVSTLDNVWWKCPVCNYSWSTSPSARVIFNKGHYDIRECPYCSGSRRKLTYAEEYPDLAARFLEQLNGCTLSDISSCHLRENYWWHCDICNEDFESSVEAMIRSRNTTYKGCSYCAGKKVTRENSFASRHPEVMDEFDPSNDIDPYSVTEYSTKTAKWICRNDNNHIWEASFSARAHGEGGCNICRGYQYGKMFFEEHAEFEQYYDKDKNTRPFSSFSNMSNDYVWWKCNKGHSFRKCICNMSRMGSFKCSICENLMIQIGVNDLASQNPELANEFDTTKNGTTPQNIIITSSNPETWWVCSEGHEFQRSVSSRIHQFSECPVCNRTIIVKGINDFQHTYPMIQDIWDYDMNVRTPDEVSDRSTDKFHFKCSKEHHYVTALITIKANNFECMVCNNKILQLGVNTLVNTDYQLSQEFSPNEKRNPSEFAKTSAYAPLWKCKVCNNDYHWPIKDRKLGDHNCPFCNNRYTKFGVNSLVDTDEELAREYTLDNEYDVTRINKESKTWAYWICPECHGRYGAYVNERELGDDSCPYCKNERALPNFNSLADTHKLLTKEWSPNNKRKPIEFVKKNIYTALWNCPTCHGEYAARICDREVGDDSCPYCNNRKALPGYNSFKVQNNELMEEWDTIDNYLLCNPDEIINTYSKDVWWSCRDCKTKYLMSPKKRLYYQRRHMKSCPYCKGLRRKKRYFF